MHGEELSLILKGTEPMEASTDLDAVLEKAKDAWGLRATGHANVRFYQEIAQPRHLSTSPTSGSFGSYVPALTFSAAGRLAAVIPLVLDRKPPYLIAGLNTDFRRQYCLLSVEEIRT